MKKILLTILVFPYLIFAQGSQLTLQSPAASPVTGSNQIFPSANCNGVTTTICPGTNTRTYYLVVHYAGGIAPLGAPAVFQHSPSPNIDTFNYVTLTWGAVPNATSYDVLKTNPGETAPFYGGTFTYGSQFCIGVTTTTCNDRGTRVSYTLPSPIGVSQGTITLNNITYSSPTMVFSTPIDISAGCVGCSTGTGSVTSVASGNLSNFFTSNVATATSTPSITFTPVAISADNIFGNFTSGSATPSTQAIPSCSNDGAHALVYDTHTLTCESITSGGTVNGNGTPAKLPVWVTNTTTLTDSAISDSGTALTLNEPTTIGSTGQSTFTLYDSGGSATVPVAGQGIFCATVVNTNDCQVQWGPTSGKIVGTGGTLASNAVVIGSGSQSIATATNASLSAGTLTLGNAAAATGAVTFNGTTSGSMTATVNATGTAMLLGSNLNWIDASGALQLGADNSIGGSIQLSNSANNAHNTITSGATTTNSLKLFTVVPTTGDLLDCTVSSTVCQLHDSGVATSTVVTSAAALPSTALVVGGGGQATSASTANSTLTAGAMTLGSSGVIGTLTMNGSASGTFALTPNSGATALQLGSANLLANASGTMSSVKYNTAGNCASAASPAVCSSASSGSVVVAAAAGTVVVNTSAVTANSVILLEDDSSLGTKLSVTCNTTFPSALSISARTAGTSFTITATAPITNPLCVNYLIIN